MGEQQSHATAPPPLVRAIDIAFRWPGRQGTALALPDLLLARGEHLFVSGPSGSGKTTLLGLLAGVIMPRQGRVEVAGTDLRSLAPSRRDRFRADHVGVIFQQLNLLPYLSVLENVLLPCRFSSRRRLHARQQAGSEIEAAGMLLERLDMARDLWRRPAAELSVGQQQRVAAARALLGRPDLVLADEPTSALDAARQQAFMALLRRECRASGAGLVMVSHDERLAEGFDRRLDMAPLPSEALP
ncbi:ABC transporter ATP-binding protein [Cupriavidus sp. AU9028]|uniref:ABC transporter ATP-binding protein n=1 Tax=Cupriavidus sp. AU9028 TaxID=2871157 RepID=UPI001C93AF7B|nr:ABC transporter ATP-binding protein [Cupriavidus sp. AU9028]MBY4899225.1 ABC transporter ATP-binding protein [Cupriavidus sp. AU9028]